MSRRPASLLLTMVLIVLVTLLSIVTEFTDSQDSPVLELIDRHSWALLVVTIPLIISVSVWLYSWEHPVPAVPKWTSSRSPYPGLDAFTEDDTSVFFGREAEKNELFDRLHPQLPDRAGRFVAVIGPSGAGKSSLVQAGLLPLLMHGRRRWEIVPPLVPGHQPMRSLARSLALALPDTLPNALKSDLEVGPQALVRCVEQLRTAHGGRAVSVLLVIDQAEELVTLTGRQERLDFLELLRTALQQDSRLWVLATLRSEFLTAMVDAGAADLFRNPMVIGPLHRTALVEVIEKPAAQAGLAFAPGVVGMLVDEAGSGDALPLLAYTLQALYERVGSGGTVTVEDYRQLGGVMGTLSRHADEVVAELHAFDADIPVLDTLLKFVTLDGDEPTRRRVARSTLTATEVQVVDAFVRARLLTSDTKGDVAVIEVAHEALLRQWAPLGQAIEAAADGLRQRAELERWAQDWERSGHRDSYLLHGERLRIAQHWAAQSDEVAQPPLVRKFLTHSRRADRATLQQLSDAVAQQALAAIESDPELGILLALAAIEERILTPLAHRALRAAVAASRIRCIVRAHEDVIWDVAWAPDGRRLATASGDHTVRVWDLAGVTEPTVLRGHEDAVEAVAWSLDGRLATGSRDRTTRIWDPATSTELTVLRGHQDTVGAVAWAPDGQRLATASLDRSARVWDPLHAEELAVFSGHQGGIRGVSWAPNSQQLATASFDQTARIWDVAFSTEPTIVLCGHQDMVLAAAWSPDSQRLATASFDHTARIWEVNGGTELAILHGHEDKVRGVAWAPDGQRLATASLDRTVRIWDIDKNTEPTVLPGHQNMIWGVAWAPDGRRLATASDDRTVRIWDIDSGTQPTCLAGHRSMVRGVAWAPDGRRLATASDDRTVLIWGVDDDTEPKVLTAHEDTIRGVTWSPDGRRLATASDDRTIFIWDIHSGTTVTHLAGHDDWAVGVAWSPSGHRIATCSLDRTIRIWDVDSGTELAVLTGHRDEIWGVAWSPDGTRLATGSDDRTARVWDVDSGTELAVLPGHDDAIRSVAWSPDGTRLATGSDDRTARIWDVTQTRDLVGDLDTLVATARTRVFRELTDGERRSAMLPETAELNVIRR